MSDMGFSVTEDDIGNDLFGEDYPSTPVEERPKWQMPGSGTTAKTSNRSATDKLIGQITKFYLDIGTGLTMLGQFKPALHQDGMIVAMSAAELAESWRDPIDKNPTIKDYWTKFFRVGGYAGLIVAHVGVGIVIAKSHGVKVPGFDRAKSKEETTDE